MSRRIPIVNYFLLNILGTLKSYSLNVHAEIFLKNLSLNLKVAIREVVRIVQYLKLRVEVYKSLFVMKWKKSFNMLRIQKLSDFLFIRAIIRLPIGGLFNGVPGMATI